MSDRKEASTDPKQGARTNISITSAELDAARRMHAQITSARVPSSAVSMKRGQRAPAVGSRLVRGTVSGNPIFATPNTNARSSAMNRADMPPRTVVTATTSTSITSTAAGTTTTATTTISETRKGPSKHICNNPRNPPCAKCGRAIIPAPKATLPLEDNPSISIGEWTISSRKKPILNSQELEDWENNKLRGLPALPEMIFGNNYVQIKNTDKEWGIEFNALDALKLVDLADPGIRVSYAQKWIDSKRRQQQRQQQQQQQQQQAGQQEFLGTEDISDSLKIVKNYDWTYSTLYDGTLIGLNKDKYPFKHDDNEKLPIDKLSKPDPILYYDDLVLFEDELADNGISVLNVKIRVMHERLLLLSRFFLRVDEVMLRVYDTRVYVEFEENKVLREFKEYEGKYEDIMKKHRISHSHDPKAALRDSNWVVEHLPMRRRKCEVIHFGISE